MLDVRKQLPQLDPLIAFEAAARHSSFALAAGELNITPSAVSQQIRSLEMQLGVSLFDRGHRSVQLTARGIEFQSSVSVALMHLVNAASEVRGADPSTRIDIATDSSIAAFWLLPRLERFRNEHPDIPVRVNVTDVQDALLNSDFDVAVAHGSGSWRGYESRELFAEDVFPVCAPTYLERLNGPLSPETLPTCALLDLEYERWHWMNWSIWLTEMGMPLPASPRKLRSNSYTLIIDAARRGEGIALGWRHLLDDDLADGRLVRPLQASVKTRYSYHVLWPYNQEPSDVVRALRDEYLR